MSFSFNDLINFVLPSKKKSNNHNQTVININKKAPL